MNTKDRIRTFIATNFSHDPAAIADDTALLESDIIDSTGVMEMVFFINEEFGIEVAPADLIPENFNSINGIFAYLEKHQQVA